MRIRIETYEKRRKFLLLAALIFLVVSIAGSIGYGCRAAFRGPDGWSLINPYVGLWFTIVLGGLALEIVLALTFGGRKSTCCSLADYVYFGHHWLCFIFIGTCYAIFGRYDLAFFAVLISIVAAVNLFTVGTIQSSEDDPYLKNFNGCLLCALWFFRAIAVVLVFLLAFGAGVHGIGYASFRPESAKFLELKLPDDRTQQLRYECFGEDGADEDVPVVIFEGREYQGYANWVGLKNAGLELKMRTCLWDKPNLGYSDYLMAYQTKSEDFLPYILEALKEQEKEKYPGPYIFVGNSETGGANAYRQALKTPEDIEGLVFLDVMKPDEERRIRIEEKGEEDDVDAALKSLFRKDWVMTMLGQLFIAPFGAIIVFFNRDDWDDKYWNDDEKAEHIWSFSIGKAWTPSYWDACDKLAMDDDPEDVYAEDLDSDIPVHAFVSNRSADQIQKQICDKYKLSEEKCALAKKVQGRLSEEERKLVRNGGEVVLCEEETCSMKGWLIAQPMKAMEEIKRIFG